MKKAVLVGVIAAALVSCVAFFGCGKSTENSDPNLILDNKYATIEVTGISESVYGTYGLDLTITNNCDEPIYVYSDITSFKVNGTSTNAWLAESINPGETITDGFIYFDSATTEADVQAGVNGIFGICNDDTWDDLQIGIMFKWSE